MFLVPAVKIQFPVRISKHSLQKRCKKRSPRQGLPDSPDTAGHTCSTPPAVSGRQGLALTPGMHPAAKRSCPTGRDAVRSAPTYSAGSTQVLAAKYNPGLRKSGSRLAQRKVPKRGRHSTSRKATDPLLAQARLPFMACADATGRRPEPEREHGPAFLPHRLH